MDSERNALSELIWAYEQTACEKASLVASEIVNGEEDVDTTNALRSYITLLYEGILTGHAFREARGFLLTQAMHWDMRPIEVAERLGMNFMLEEIVVRAALRSIATMARDLDVIGACRLNWHKLHKQFKEAAAESYGDFCESESMLEVCYA